MRNRTRIPLAAIGLALLTTMVAADQSIDVVTKGDIQFQPLNPLRGDASPKAGVLWGDIKKDVPTGTLLEFADGFSSPPHIHNITYRAVVISGALHNDDPEAKVAWMEPGSYWTQPAGENHITAAKAGDKATAFLEILEGPYLVRPASEEFDNGERPINLNARNVVWLDASDISWVNSTNTLRSESGVEIAFLWEQHEPSEQNGTFLKLPSGFAGTLRDAGDWMRSVVITGEIQHHVDTADQELNSLEAGTYFGSKDKTFNTIKCVGESSCILYISAIGRYEVGITN